MPIYEYQCGRCGVFEVTQRITEDPLRVCPTCKGAVRRLISHTSFMLKGTGWYATDYGRSGSAGTNGQSGSSTATTSSDTAAKSNESSSKEKSSSGSNSGEKTPAA